MNNEKGVSIIEIMIAMTILAVVLLAMMSMFNIGINQTVLSGNITTATQLANGKMEEIRNIPFDEIDDRYYSTGYNNQGYDAQVPATYVQEDDPDFPNYERHVNIQYVESDLSITSDPPSNLLKVMVRVIWTTNTGAQREHEAVTLIGK